MLLTFGAANAQIADVQVKGSWINVYDEKCKEISSMSSSGKTVRGASGNSFTVKVGSWINTYDKNCKEISSRSAN